MPASPPASPGAASPTSSIAGLRALVDRYYNALACGDVDEAMRCYAPSAAVEDPVGSAPLTGGEIRARHAEEPVRTAVDEYFFAPAAGVVSTRVTSSLWDAETGKRTLAQGTHEFSFSEGLIVSMRALWAEDRGTRLSVVCVTGGASGIGEAIARRFSRDGFQVVIADVDDARGTALAERIYGCFVRTDVSQPAEVESLVALCVERFGGLDVMVANAGVLGELARTGDYPGAPTPSQSLSCASPADTCCCSQTRASIA